MVQVDVLNRENPQGQEDENWTRINIKCVVQEDINKVNSL